MKYLADAKCQCRVQCTHRASTTCGAWNGEVTPDHITEDPALALRHARAMKAVLLAAKAWAKAATALEVAYERDVHVSAGAPIAQRHLDATKRLLDAQARLAKIEKEVSRG